MPNLELRNRTYHAVLTLPKDVRDKLGRLRFKRSLGTPNKREAELLAAPYIAKWKALIRQARGDTNAVALEAMRWRDELSRIDDVEAKETLETLLTEAAVNIEQTKGYADAKTFYDIAKGVQTPTLSFFDSWKAQIDATDKTKDQMIKDVTLLTSRFSILNEITKSSVKKWVDDLTAEGKSFVSIDRILGFCRNYWRYLQSHDAVPTELEPLRGVLVISKAAKTKARKTVANAPYAADAVVSLWSAASNRNPSKRNVMSKDTDLANLILLAAYSGARIEELCSLKASNVIANSFHIADSKTAAGVRIVPIHSKLTALVEALKIASKDGYLISGLTFNKYGDRSNAIGKRFGRLKTALGFGKAHTFHSFRSTVVTQLENAGVPENLAADIVGHEKPRITYGLYSGGADLKAKRDALEKVTYPFPGTSQTN